MAPPLRYRLFQRPVKLCAMRRDQGLSDTKKFLMTIGCGLVVVVALAMKYKVVQADLDHSSTGAKPLPSLTTLVKPQDPTPSVSWDQVNQPHVKTAEDLQAEADANNRAANAQMELQQRIQVAKTIRDAANARDEANKAEGERRIKDQAEWDAKFNSKRNNRGGKAVNVIPSSPSN